MFVYRLEKLICNLDICYLNLWNNVKLICCVIREKDSDVNIIYYSYLNYSWF